MLNIVCRRVHVLFTLFVFVCVLWCSTYIVFCFCFVCLVSCAHYVGSYSGLSIFERLLNNKARSYAISTKRPYFYYCHVRLNIWMYIKTSWTSWYWHMTSVYAARYNLFIMGKPSLYRRVHPHVSCTYTTIVAALTMQSVKSC